MQINALRGQSRIVPSYYGNITAYVTPRSEGHQKEFEDFVMEQFLDQKKGGITRTKEDLIMDYLAGRIGPFDAHFKF